MNLHLDTSGLNPGQFKILESRAWRVLVAGGFGSGKTTSLAYKLLQLKSANPGVPGLLVAPTWRLMWSVTLRSLLRVLRASLPPAHWPKVKDRTGECYLDFGDGVPLFLRSATHPSTIDGLDVGYALGDELRYWSREAYQVTLARVRVRCPQPQNVFASTPAMGWMSDDFNAGKPGHQLIVAPTRENIRNLEPGFIERLRQSYSPRLQRAVIDGVFTILEGAVFEAFDPNPQTSPWIVPFDAKAGDRANNKHYLCADPGYRRSAWIWVQEIAPAKWIVIDQLMLDNSTDGDAVRAVNARGWPIDEIWIDPAARAKQSTMGLDTLQLVRQIKCRNTSPIRLITGVFRDIAYGIDKLRVTVGDPYNRSQPLRLGFARSVADAEAGKPRGIIRDLGGLRYADDREGRPVRDVPTDDGVTSHSTDALRYFAVGRWVSDVVLKGLEEDSRLKAAVKSGGYKIAA